MRPRGRPWTLPRRRAARLHRYEIGAFGKLSPKRAFVAPISSRLVRPRDRCGAEGRESLHGAGQFVAPVASGGRSRNTTRTRLKEDREKAPDLPLLSGG